MFKLKCTKGVAKFVLYILHSSPQQPPASLSRQQTHDDGAADADSFELYCQVIQSQLGEISNPKRAFQVFIKMYKKITDLKKQH